MPEPPSRNGVSPARRAARAVPPSRGGPGSCRAWCRRRRRRRRACPAGPGGRRTVRPADVGEVLQAWPPCARGRSRRVTVPGRSRGARGGGGGPRPARRDSPAERPLGVRLRPASATGSRPGPDEVGLAAAGTSSLSGSRPAGRGRRRRPRLLGGPEGARLGELALALLGQRLGDRGAYLGRVGGGAGRRHEAAQMPAARLGARAFPASSVCRAATCRRNPERCAGGDAHGGRGGRGEQQGDRHGAH